MTSGWRGTAAGRWTGGRGRLLAAALVATLVLVVTLPGPVVTTAQVSQTGLPPVERAPPGTTFQTLFRTSGGGGETVGLVKRGRSGGFLFNPSTDALALTRGDSLVARDGTQYRVTQPQGLLGGTGFVGPGATIYRGERGIRYVDIGARELLGPNGTESQPLVLNGTVPADQPLGAYLNPATMNPVLTVREPTVTDVRVLDKFGREVGTGDRLTPNDFALVVADVNFLDASRARMVLVDPVTGRAETAGVLTRRGAQMLFPAQTDIIARTIPPEHARPERGDVTVRSLANPVHESNSTIYLVQYLRPIRQPGRYEFVVGADDREPYGDLFDVGVWRTVKIDHTLSGTTFVGSGSPEPGTGEETVSVNATTTNRTAGETA